MRPRPFRGSSYCVNPFPGPHTEFGLPNAGFVSYALKLSRGRRFGGRTGSIALQRRGSRVSNCSADRQGSPPKRTDDVDRTAPAAVNYLRWG